MRFALLLVVCLLCMILFSKGQPQAYAQQTEHAAQSNKRVTEESPAAVKAIPPANNAEETTTEKQERKEKPEAEWWLVKLTGILAFIGFLQLIVFGLQARRLRQTIDEMKIATKATEKAADAAKLSSITYQTAERAWVSVSNIVYGDFSKGHVKSTGEVKDGKTIEMIWKNAGRTPALRCSALCQIEIIVPPYGDVPFFKSSESKTTKQATLIPGAVVRCPRCYIFEEDIDKLQKGQCRVFVYGCVKYEDVFFEGYVRQTEACVEAIFVGYESESKRMILDFIPIGHQNTAT